MPQPQPTITTTYAGEFAGEYISGALLSGNTLANGLITVKPNVKFKSVIKTFATDTTSIADASCAFTDTADISLAEKILEPKEFQQNLILCKDQFQSDWEAVQMGYSAFDNLPPKFSDFLIAHSSQQVAQFVEQKIWSGTAGAGSFNGFTANLTADATVLDVAGTTVNAGNVIAELGKIVDAIPTAVYGKEDMFLYVSQNIARAYVRALGGFGSIANAAGANGVDNRGTLWYGMGQELAFDGVKLVVADGLADNTAVAAQKSNLYFGTGLLSDHNLVKVIDMADIDGSQQVRVVMRFTAGIQHGIGADIVLYS
tara:strand:+ start:4345 stop:5283 length:939 start_codon:yes stop_codon:yes gene_type:complete